MEETGVEFEYMSGTMIELPRAALTAYEAEFLSSGISDLTQTTSGMSRDDAEGKFLPSHIENGILG